jgi:hypothetical protein
MHDEPSRNATLDFAIGLAGLWLAAGFLWDSWAHLHVGVESFFTPYHAVFYSAMVFAACAFGIEARRNTRRGFHFPHLWPAAYQRALLGVPLFFLGGLGDFFWHTFFGVENRIEAVTSPTHLIIGFAVALVLSGPVRSALADRGTLLTLRSQLAVIFSLAAILEFAHLGMSYAFDPSAARMDAPPSEVANSPYYLLDVALVLYKTGTGVMIVILTSLVGMAFALYLASRFRLAPGAMTLFFVLGDSMMAAALTNDRPLLAIHFVKALVAGIVADTILARGRTRGAPPAGADTKVLRRFGIFVPAAYYGTFFTLTIGFEGTWWNWNLVLGTLVWSILAGYGLTFLVGDSSPFAPRRAVATELSAEPVDAVVSRVPEVTASSRA